MALMITGAVVFAVGAFFGAVMVAVGSKGGGIAYPLFPCEVLPEVQRQAAP